MNFGELVAKGGALFLKKKLSAVQAVYDAAPAGEKAAFQASVSGGWCYVNRVLPSDGTRCQEEMEALMLNSAYTVFVFNKGVYGATINNRISGRTFIFEEGAIIDGTIHLAIGTGPETTGNPLSPIARVENTSVIGQMVSTDRIGWYYASNISAPGGCLLLGPGAWQGQVVSGGCRGLHGYYGSRDINIGPVVIEDATYDAYAVSIDTNAYTDAEHRPTRVHIHSLTVKNVTGVRIGVQMINTTDCSIGDIHVGKVIGNTGVNLVGNDGLRFGRLKVVGSGSTSGVYGMINTDTELTAGAIDIDGITSIGFAASGTKRLMVGDFKVSGCSGGNINLAVPGHADIIRTSGGYRGITMLAGSEGFFADRVETAGATTQGFYSTIAHNVGSVKASGGATGVYSTGGNARFGDIEASGASSECVLLQGDSVKTGDIYVHDATGNGLNNTGATSLITGNFKAIAVNQGIRMLSGSAKFGHILLKSCTRGLSGIQGSITGWSHLSLTYVTNAEDANIVPESLPGFASLVGNSFSGNLGDVDYTYAATSPSVLWFNSSFTAARTVTFPVALGTSGKTVRVVRSVNSGGSSLSLNIGSKTLATGTWADVTGIGGSWALTASGSL